jgi:flagellar basal-body rod modification protein FlgD
VVDSVTGPGTASVGTLAESMTGSQEMGREEFLKLLIAQLQHQDPLEPQENSAFVAELAQFSSLEQAMGINERLDLLALQQQGLSNSQVTALVGHQATLRGSIVTLDGSGIGTQVSFDLAGSTEETTLSIRDQSGRLVREIDLGSRPEGTNTITWDGRDASGTVQPEGSYVVTVTTKNADGNAVGVSQETTGTIKSVSFDQGYPVLHLDNGVSAPVSDLLRVAVPEATETPSTL